MAEDTPRKTVEELRKLFDLTGKVAVVTGAGARLATLCARASRPTAPILPGGTSRPTS